MQVNSLLNVKKIKVKNSQFHANIYGIIIAKIWKILEVVVNLVQKMRQCNT